jgi:type IV pilus assembly protein PilV
VEVLVAIVVLSVALVGAAGVQAVDEVRRSVLEQRATAVQQASALIERMRANVAGAAMNPGPYVFDAQYANIPQAMVDMGIIPACTGGCTPEDLAKNQLHGWLTSLGRRCPGAGNVTRLANANGSPYAVTVMWTEKEMSAAQRTPTCRPRPPPMCSA